MTINNSINSIEGKIPACRIVEPTVKYHLMGESVLSTHNSRISLETLGHFRLIKLFT